MAQGLFSGEGRQTDAKITKAIVIDTSVFVVSLLDENVLNSEEKKQRTIAMEYVDGLRNGEYVAYLPGIALIEIAGVANKKAGVAAARVTNNRLGQWVDLGLIRLYDPDESRMKSAANLAVLYNVSRNRSISAADAMSIGLVEELDIDVISFEEYFSKVSSKAVVPE